MEKWSSDSPRVAVTRSVASSADCSHVIGLAEASQRLAPGLTKGNKLAAGRSSDVVWLAHDASPQLWALTQRCAALAERPLRCAEHWQVIRYATGGEYRRHYDAYCPRASKGFAKTTATSGNRVTTCLLYLNTVERGGATRFWRLPSAEDGSGAPPRDVRATEGSVLVFDNCYSAEEGAEEEEKETAPSAATTVAVRHPLSEHSGMPVEAGVKWAANLWFRERPTRQGVATLHRVARQREGAPATSPPLPPSDAAWFARFDELSRDAHVEQAEGRRDAALALLRQAAVHCNMGQLPPRLQRRIDALELEGGGEEEESSRLLPPPPSNPSRSGCCACIFDLDGTLVDSTALAFDATNVVLTAAGYAAVTRDDYHAGCMHTTPRRLALHAIGDPDGLAVGAPLAAAFDAHYIARVDATSAGFFPGVGKMLRELVAMGGREEEDSSGGRVRLGVLSNACGDYVRKVLRANIPGLEQEQEQGGLLKPSSALPCDAPIDRAAQLGADDVPKAKPDPVGVRQVLAVLGVAPNPARSWYVGDSPSDGDAARAAGVTAIGVSWGAHSRKRNAPHFDVMCDTVEELRAALVERVGVALLL